MNEIIHYVSTYMYMYAFKLMIDSMNEEECNKEK